MRSGPESNAVHCSTDTGRRDSMRPEQDGPSRPEIYAELEQDRRHEAWLRRQADEHFLVNEEARP